MKPESLSMDKREEKKNISKEEAIKLRKKWEEEMFND